ncbi:glycosyltransferase family 9 protein [Corynebacterium halotolerans]|uniref:Glycosyl transferase family protein n=1 Tax=Corynebacterium halotolerans YIM 70093 = DSM 44683 TaxID=1121362 RepID=M1NX93_9CORY|nr:glycosyltransferase family 9 protein [Corynebacterium halotolerans]AGF72110.1 glycosyl transferase family protein [Corynebacterium halotolerans YIM 70093 = DSM 44683]
MKKVLVARLDSVGDVLVTGPAIRAVAAHPEVGEVTLLCGPQGRAAAELLPGPSEIFTWASPWTIVPAPSADAAHIETLRAFVAERGFDEAVIFTSFHQSPLPLALVLRMAGVPRISGASVDFPGSLLDVRLKPGEDFPEDQPEVERALGIAEAAGYPLPAGDDGRMRVADPAGSFFGSAGHTFAEQTAPYVVVHPGAAVPARMWPAERSAAAVELLAERGHTVVVTGGAGEKELTAWVAGESGIDLGGVTDLRQTAEVLSRASVVVSGNTGPAHLAAAVGTPVVSLFSPVVPPIRWAPYGVPVELLGDQTAACRGTRARDCPVPGHPCLSSVTAGEVADAVERLWPDDRPRPRPTNEN